MIIFPRRARKLPSTGPRRPVVVPTPSDLEKLANVLNSGKRITLLCGSGCAGAHEALIALGERLKAPMVHAMRGKEHVEWENPYDVGMTGLIGFSSGYYAMLDCGCLNLHPSGGESVRRYRIAENTAPW